MDSPLSTLPIDEHAAEIRDNLRRGCNTVLIAPPGAGKSTHLPLLLADEDWLRSQKVVLVVPRRLAVLGAAGRMADQRGEKVGETVGYRIRFDTKVSARTRIEVMTDGVFARLITQDPSLEGIGLVVFDEVHERSLFGDLGLAFTLESAQALRPDLRIMVMSATIDGGDFAGLFAERGPVATVQSKGRMHPVETLYQAPIGDPVQAVVDAAIKAKGEYKGDGLAFLPGQSEINEAVADLRSRCGDGVAVHALYGAIDQRTQRAALAPDDRGRRKLIVASAIAETSLTVPGVRFVIDSGLARRPRFDPLRGLTRLETGLASKASVDQRRGRAGREAPGLCVRLWREEAHGSRPTQDRPEIFDSDLASLRLACADWGARTRTALSFLDAPPRGAWEEAGRLLTTLGALDADGAPTPLGRTIARSPAHPRLAAMLARTTNSEKSDAAWAATLVEELRDKGPTSGHARLEGALQDKSASHRVQALHRRFTGNRDLRPVPDAGALARHLMHAYPDWVAKRLKDDGRWATYKLAQGMQATIDSVDRLADETFLLVLDMSAGKRGDGALTNRIRLALPLEEAMIRAQLGHLITEETVFDFLSSDWTLRQKRQTKLGTLVLGETSAGKPAPTAIYPYVKRLLREKGLTLLAQNDESKGVIERYQAFLQSHSPASRLMDRVDIWVPALVETGSPPFTPTVLKRAFDQALSWDEQRAFSEEWPATLDLPSGRSLPILYDHPAGAAITARPQWLFGLDTHPRLGTSGHPLVIEFLSPASRPIAITSDLPSFWRNGWLDVRRDMRARYPKHEWPDQPWTSRPATGKQSKSKR